MESHRSSFGSDLGQMMQTVQMVQMMQIMQIPDSADGVVDADSVESADDTDTATESHRSHIGGGLGQARSFRQLALGGTPIHTGRETSEIYVI